MADYYQHAHQSHSSGSHPRVDRTPPRSLPPVTGSMAGYPLHHPAPVHPVRQVGLPLPLPLPLLSSSRQHYSQHQLQHLPPQHLQHSQHSQHPSQQHSPHPSQHTQQHPQQHPQHPPQQHPQHLQHPQHPQQHAQHPQHPQHPPQHVQHPQHPQHAHYHHIHQPPNYQPTQLGPPMYADQIRASYGIGAQPVQVVPLLGMESYFGFVRTPQDAVLLFEACRVGRLHRVQRRLTDNERQLIRPGSVFIWDEVEAGMRRWTDGKSWSASRVSGSFLTYREMEGRKSGGAGYGGTKRKHAGLQSGPAGPSNDRGVADEADEEDQQNGEDSGPDGYRYKPDGLVKQSFSITTRQGVRLHLISYFTRRDNEVDRLAMPSTDPFLRDINPLKGMYPDTSSSGSADPSATPPPGSVYPHSSPSAGQVPTHPVASARVPPPVAALYGYSYAGQVWAGGPTVPVGYGPVQSSPSVGSAYSSPGPAQSPYSSRPGSMHGSGVVGMEPPRSVPGPTSGGSGMGIPVGPIPFGRPESSASPEPGNVYQANGPMRPRPYSTIEQGIVSRSPAVLSRFGDGPRRSNSSRVPSSYHSNHSPGQHTFAPYRTSPDRSRRTISPQLARPTSSSSGPLPGIKTLLNDEGRFVRQSPLTGPSETTEPINPTTRPVHISDGQPRDRLFYNSDETTIPGSQPFSGSFRLPAPTRSRDGCTGIWIGNRCLPPLASSQSGQTCEATDQVGTESWNSNWRPSTGRTHVLPPLCSPSGPESK